MQIVKETGYIDTSDDMKLYFEKNLVTNPKAVIIIVHGMCEHLGRYEYIKDKFNHFSYNVYRFDFRGHGKSGGKRGYIDDFNKIIDDAHIFIEIAKQENKELPLIMIGHSWGAFIAVGHDIKYPNKIDYFVLTNTTMDDGNRAIKHFDTENDSMSYLTNNVGKFICSDQNVCKAYDEDPLVVHEIPIISLHESSKAIDWLNANIEKFNSPVFILHGSEDQMASYDDSISFYHKISSTDKDLKIYDNFWHEILNEREKDIVIEDIHKWIDVRIEKKLK